MKKQARVLRPVPIRQWVLSMSVLSGAGPTPQPGGARKTALVGLSGSNRLVFASSEADRGNGHADTWYRAA